ncbi:YkgJ family cysteine cluster protein [Aureimonas mangrovi]|uniref:YkgJ family cysteine cluster protein n=1 Tax=Aureimonas mangrovi TaxID=2758041 RepID=UPI00163DE006|nr:YkgJ family cysteine cluster protein [Aureimonas mangrovi]
MNRSLPFDCQTCGACCAHSADWPRFSTEPEERLDALPPAFVSSDLSGMRCEDDRCSALSGVVGERTSCLVYALRPDVCRACMPGDPECITARRARGLPI